MTAVAHHTHYQRRAAVLLCVLLVGCESPADVSNADVTALELRSPSTLTRSLHLTLAKPAAIAVEYWTAGSPRLRIEADSSAARHSVVLSRLRPGRAYEYEVVGTSRRGTFTVEPLPADLAQVGVNIDGSPTVPLVLLHLFQPNGFKGYAVVDQEGFIVWYWRTNDFPFGMTRRSNGNFVFMDKARGLVEVTVAGDVVRELAQDTIQREQHHDVVATPHNTVLFIAFDRREHAGVPLKGEAIWEWTPESNTVVRRWTSWDFLSPEADRGPRFGVEWMHANALGIGPRGNVVLSVHYFNQIISIAADWRSIEWRLGGVNATIPVPTTEQFSGQHTARELAPGRVILFDNRRDPGGPSRAVEFELNGVRAETRWEWSPSRDNYASAVSSVRRLENGNTLVAFGMSTGLAGSTGPTEVYEVTSTGHLVSHMVITNTQVMYRAEPLTSLSGEQIVRK